MSLINLPEINISEDPSIQCSTVPVTTKELGLAQNRVEIARQHGEAMKHISSYDLFQTNPLFEGKVSKK